MDEQVLALTPLVDFAHFALMLTLRSDVLGIAIVKFVNAMLGRFTFTR